ncbi:putative DNA-directed RNA polymerase 2, RPB12 subunit [Trypanosoma cruzi]|uniref:DNA-directed RNA polymerase 2, RPB12 subunit n=2 Tax=Trypanosoma cruzi TaxID=5693 RepID=Q4DS11_TRYCC|nr:hypothetical protein, conserved [Trypanosoma cruzi]EAN95317.1 hypothetical protein, conserved [Trypanosoma cruzi]PWV08701.1 putative DNA-directed RNA polymerase 2, RPB12 subunit [Trypanosoma cruzi]|eukprot:XP_817168.1 hypothetical protein [Trypanosoma cruzi strain CL Brener]
MLSFSVKEEQKDVKSLEETGIGDTTENARESMTLYTCANCTRVVALTQSSQLMCTHCVHRTGSSTVFYKLRTQPTTYDTI